MSQPLRFAYISIVIAVHEARLAASSSWGLGPVSSPPFSSGSSAVIVWVRIATSCLKVPLSRLALALMASTLLERVEQQARWHLWVEEGRLRRHRFAGLRHLAHLIHRRRAQKERGIGTARLHRLDRVSRALRVADPVLPGDVVLGHPECLLQDQPLEQGRVKAPV